MRRTPHSSFLFRFCLGLGCALSLSCFSVGLCAADLDLGDKPAPVDDPIGLGERLALIDYLRDEQQQQIPAHPSLQDLRRLYWRLANAETKNEAHLERDRIVRLRHSLEVTYAIVIPESSSYEDLLKIQDIHQAKSKRTLEKIRAAAQDDAADNNLSNPSSSSNSSSHNSTSSPNSNAMQRITRERSASDNFATDVSEIKKSVVLIGTKTSTGSGFFISNNGYLITNQHVVGADSVGKQVGVFWDASEQRQPEYFTVVALGGERDLALLQPSKPGKKYQALTLSDTYALTADVLVAGYPLGASVGQSLGTNAVDLTLTKGAISAIRRKQERIEYLQVDASASQGNSGGPLLDQHSHAVLGIITQAIDPKDSGARGAIMTFAIPAAAILETFPKYLK